MRWRVVNLLLAPVFTLTLVCSLAKLQINTPRLAKKLTTACPFHPNMTIEVEQEGTGVTSGEGKRCHNCLSESMLREQSESAQHDVLLVAIRAGEAASYVAQFAEEADFRAAAFPFASGPPPFGALPLRV